MAAFPQATSATPVNPVIAVPGWAWALVALALFSVYFLVHENGALLSSGAAGLLHELTHDARHALGVPCH